MKSFAFFALLLLAATAEAQTPADQIKRLQNDPNVVWIGEIYRDYEDIDHNYEGRNIDRSKPETLPDGNVLYTHKQNTTTLKRQASGAYYQDWEYHIWRQMIEPNVPVFADANLTQRLSAKAKEEALTSLDTVITFDAETFAEYITVVTNQTNPDDIYAYRLRQLVYYNSKENMYYNLPLSIAPIQIQYDDNGNRTGIKPLFWLPIVASSTPINPSQAPNMSVIRSVAMDMPLTDAKILKKSKSVSETNKMWFDYMRSQQNNILAVSIAYSDNDKNADASLSPQELAETLNANPEILGLRINQTFGWDESKKIFTIATYSVAPLIPRIDEDVRQRLFPLFYVYPHRRFKTVPK